MLTITPNVLPMKKLAALAANVGNKPPHSDFLFCFILQSKHLLLRLHIDAYILDIVAENNANFCQRAALWLAMCSA